LGRYVPSSELASRALQLVGIFGVACYPSAGLA
jgi:hypothetical protein